MMKKILLFTTLIFSLSCFSQAIGIVGPAANGWPDDDSPEPDIVLTNNGDGTHSIDGITLNTGPAKFREDLSWDVNYGGDTFPSGAITNGDIPVQAGVYDIVLDLNNDTYTFTNVGEFQEITIAGSALESPITLSTADGDLYEAPVSQFGTGTVLFTSSNGDVYGVNDDTPENALVLDGDPIPVEEGYYSVELFLANLDYSLTVPAIGLVGPAISDWPDGENPTPDVLMNTTDNGLTYIIEQVELLEGECKFRQNQSWDVNWGSSGELSGDLVLNGSDNFLITEAAPYTIFFDRLNGTYLFDFVDFSSSDFERGNFSIYPNPTKNVWHLESSAFIHSVEVFSVTGRLIQRKQVSELQTQIDANELKSGIYMVKVELNSGAQKTFKLIKQ